PLLLAGLTVAGCAQVSVRAGSGADVAAPPSSAAASPALTPAAARDNPFFAPSTLPYHAPPFDRITNADYQPALEEGMRQQLAEVEAIANQAAEPTFDNTLVAMERTGALLARVYHPDVRVFEVFEADGSPLALIYFDYFKRDNKGGG